MRHSGLDPSKFNPKVQAQIAEQLYGSPKNSPQVPDPKPQPKPPGALGRPEKREAKVLSRPLVRFTGYRVRPLDPDNFAGSCKNALDGLRHAGILDGDEPWRIRFVTEQEKVYHFKNERTEIEIIY